MIVEDNFFAEPEQFPAMITLGEICERLTTAGFPCKAERLGDEARIIFAGRKSNLVLTLNPVGRPLTATMTEEADYDADFACAVFDVFDSIGWTFAPK
jgi:hypothetical protein